MTLSDKTRTARSAETRKALIKAGLHLFGSRGFEPTSTRDLAARAGTNPASIAYHFGNKHGLRRACGAWIADEIGAVADRHLASAGETPDARTARAVLLAMPDIMAAFVLARSPDDDFVPFLLREITEPGEVFQQVYGTLFLPMHTRFCRIWAAATGGDPQSAQTRLEVFALIGQLLYFRIAREAVLRRMDWQAYGAAEITAIAGVCRTNMDALIATAAERNRTGQQP